MDAYLTEKDPKEISEIFFKIIDSYTDSITKTLVANNNLDETKDSRLITFLTLRQVANNSLLSSIFVKDHLTNKKWWESNKNFSLPVTGINEYVEDIIYKYSVDLIANYVMLSFTHFENSLRSIVKAIPNSKHPFATEDFWRIRDYLIAYSEINSDYISIVKIFQNIRNSFHNGGFHSRDTETITYKSRIFLFEKNKPITFDVWDTIEFIFLEINQVLYELVNSNNIKNINFIPHPFSTINFIRKI